MSPVFGITPLLVTTLSASALPLVRVEGDSVCPTPEQVAGQLARFLPARPPNIDPDDVRVDADAAGVRVALRRADGALVGERTLEVNASCADVAEAVGIIVALWEWPLRPGLVPRLELPPPPTDGTRAKAATNIPPAPPKILPAPPAAPPPPAPPPTAAPPPAPPTAVATRAADTSESTSAATTPLAVARWHVEAGAGFREVFPDLRPGVLLEAALRKQTAWWGARLTLGGAWWSSATLGPGQVAWTRLAAGLGLIHGWSGRHLFLDVHEEVLAAVLVAEGRGYDDPRRRQAFDPGVGLGLRAGIVTGGVRIWIDGSGAWWPIQQRMGVGNVSGTVEAAPIEAALSIGGTFAGGP
jgi:hypothetical protein